MDAQALEIFALGLQWTIGTGRLWLCLDDAGMGICIEPVAKGEAWDWSTSYGYWRGCGNGQSGERIEAVVAGLRSLIAAGIDVGGLPRSKGQPDRG